MPMKVTYQTINGEILSEIRGGVRKQYVPDPLGSTAVMTDSTGSITDTFEYWPYGEVRTRTGSSTTPFQYVGTLGYYTDSSSRTYVRARTLRTDLTRWLTEDPIRFDGGDWNLYGYVYNGPGSGTDPSGLWCWKIFGRCIGTTCNTRPDCPARKPRPLPGKPAPYPWTPPHNIPLPPKIPGTPIPLNPIFSTPSPGTGAIKGMCQTFCEGFMCPGKYLWIGCVAGCDALCARQTNCHSIGEGCKTLGPQCQECCDQMLGEKSGAAVLACQLGCKD